MKKHIKAFVFFGIWMLVSCLGDEMRNLKPLMKINNIHTRQAKIEFAYQHIFVTPAQEMFKDFNLSIKQKTNLYITFWIFLIIGIAGILEVVVGFLGKMIILAKSKYRTSKLCKSQTAGKGN